MAKRIFAVLFVSALLFPACATKPVIKEEPPKPPQKTLSDLISEFKTAVQKRQLPFPIPPGARVDSVTADTIARMMTIEFSRQLSYLPFREDNVGTIYREVGKALRTDSTGYGLVIRTLGRPVGQLVPNYFRKDTAGYDHLRMPALTAERPLPVVRNASRPVRPTLGLYDRNIVVWPSHGWYYNGQGKRWEWQRPRLFISVEDKIPLSIVLPYLVPMLENAGARVFVPRERDIQQNEVVVDNDSPGDRKAKAYIETSRRKQTSWMTGDSPGFSYRSSPYPVDFNPFAHGTTRVTHSELKSTASVKWVPRIPETGSYAVYVSYAASPDNVTDAHYTVYHEGGTTEFLVNQQIGGGTWQYLGTFRFRAGVNQGKGMVVETNQSSSAEKLVSADAVRFGGGIGVVERDSTTGGRPKYLEGSRYYLQYAGMPDTLVYSFNKDTNDYNDDYKSRPEYVNFLRGAPYGPNKNRSVKGLGIPVDVSLAFHTDAGITHNDTTIGTLSIYSTQGADSQMVFPDGVSRLANRDLADIVQTQIVQDLRQTFDPIWSRRELRDANYAESVRPNVPSMLLELLSHQNFLDMKYILDPRFRFGVARAVYKGILRFLSAQYRIGYAVTPLPVTHLTTEFSSGDDILLRWHAAADSLEPTAVPQYYVVYTRLGDGGFDNGRRVDSTSIVTPKPRPNVIYSFKVTAVNEGGESFPSEILSVCKGRKADNPILIVNGFTRISGAAPVESPGFSGFLQRLDAGVQDHVGLNIAGEQHDFDPASVFRSNDAPGHGASDADYETALIAGNTFDYPYVHGTSLQACGFSFVSAGVDAVVDTMVDLGKYRGVDLILGKQKETHWQKGIVDSLRGTRFTAFPQRLQEQIRRYLLSGGNLFVSGSYVASDLFAHAAVDSSNAEFGTKVLKFNFVTDHACRRGEVSPVGSTSFGKVKSFRFNTDPAGDVYAVEAPDELGPVSGSATVLRYAENQFSAATAYKGEYGVVAFGFPFETILGQQTRDEVMRAVLRFLDLR